MVASEFEYRQRFWIIVLVYGVAYAFYNVDRLNILYAIVPWNRGIAYTNLLVRLLYAAAALIAAAGAFLLTWSSAYRSTGARTRQTAAFAIGGPFRYLRNPHSAAYFLLILALGTFQSRLGFPVMLFGEALVLWRLIAREERNLAEQYGDRFQAYARCVPRLVPSLYPRVGGDGQPPQWLQSLRDCAFVWGLVATLIAFCVTLSDPVGYSFAGITLLFLVLRKAIQPLVARLRRT